MGVDYNFLENYEEWFFYIILVFIDFYGMFGFRWFFYMGIIRDFFGSIVFLFVGNFNKNIYI